MICLAQNEKIASLKEFLTTDDAADIANAQYEECDEDIAFDHPDENTACEHPNCKG